MSSEEIVSAEPYEELPSHVILVAVEVYGLTRAGAQATLIGELAEHPVSASDSPIESWWIAEDFRIDRSDRDSAVFVAKGFQARASRLLEQHDMAASWNITPLELCADCGAGIRQLEEKALSGETATVWSSDESWTCPETGDEHRPLYRRD